MRSSTRHLAFVSIFLILVSAFAFSQNSRHPFAIDDAAVLHSATAVAVSPDGKNILDRKSVV